MPFDPGMLTTTVRIPGATGSLRSMDMSRPSIFTTNAGCVSAARSCRCGSNSAYGLA